MSENKEWLKFLITGNPQNYLNYKNHKKEQEMYRGEETAYYDRWSCDKRDEYKG